MIKKVLLVLVPLLAFLGGAAAGDMLGSKGEPAAEGAAEEASEAGGHGAEEAAAKPAEPEAGHAAPGGEGGHAAAPAGEHGAEGEVLSTIFKFANQFFVPVVRNGSTDSVMIMTVTLDTAPGTLETVAAQENRLRDSLLRSLIIHANTGGFDGNFTAEASLGRLRESLLKAARDICGPDVVGVLIEDIARKES